MSSSQGSGSEFESYGRLLTLLLPRMRNFAVHDGYANLIWSTPDWHIENASDFVRQAISAGLQDQADMPALCRAIDSDRAVYVFALRAKDNDILAVVSLEVSIPANQGAPRPVEALRPFVLPAIECLQRELELRNAVGGHSAQLTPRTQAAPQPARSVFDLAALDEILRTAFEFVDCALAAVWIPERDLSLSLTSSGKRMSAQLLRGPQQQLVESMQQHQRTIVVNHSGGAAGIAAAGPKAAAYKILACPIAFRDGRLAGVLGFFNPPSADDFQQAQVRFAELLAKCTAALVNRGQPTPVPVALRQVG